MILCKIEDSSLYASISPSLALAIDWLRKNFDKEFVKGEKTIGNAGAGDVIVKCEEPALLPRERVSLESHRRYIDIHVPLKGTETIGWAPESSLKHPRQEYDAEHDIKFWGDAATSLLHLPSGQIAIFFPGDAHAPNIGLGNHRKLCIKIPVG